MTKDNNKKIKGTKKTNSEKKDKVTPPSITPFEQLTKEDQENLTKFINSLNLIPPTAQTQPETIEELLKENSTEKDFDALAPIILEFMKSFIVIGYSLKGERILITYASNQQQRDALLEQLRLVFLRFMNGHAED